MTGNFFSLQNYWHSITLLSDFRVRVIIMWSSCIWMTPILPGFWININIEIYSIYTAYNVCTVRGPTQCNTGMLHWGSDWGTFKTIDQWHEHILNECWDQDPDSDGQRHYRQRMGIETTNEGVGYPPVNKLFKKFSQFCLSFCHFFSFPLKVLVSNCHTFIRCLVFSLSLSLAADHFSFPFHSCSYITQCHLHLKSHASHYVSKTADLGWWQHDDPHLESSHQVGCVKRAEVSSRCN